MPIFGIHSLCKIFVQTTIDVTEKIDYMYGRGRKKKKRKKFIKSSTYYCVCTVTGETNQTSKSNWHVVNNNQQKDYIYIYIHTHARAHTRIHAQDKNGFLSVNITRK